MRFSKVILIIILVGILTVTTQVGGLVFLLSLTTHRIIERKLSDRAIRIIAKVTSFVLVYVTFMAVLIPLLAKPFGRVPLPMFEKNQVKPVTIWTCILNRNYVRPALREATFEVAESMNRKYPGTTINYLDANFPFINEFPLWPHLSHDDGKKLDLAFLYRDAKSDQPTNEVPSCIGYGVCEEPRPHEENRPAYCEERGYWQYSFMSQKIVSQARKKDFMFDEVRTKNMITHFVSLPEIGKILIEPHLKTRMNLTSRKIRLHGCQAVRHDDHIHVQLK